MKTKVLIIAVIENEDGRILFRKKFAGSKPYMETWYLFGADFVEGKNPETTLADYLHHQVGIIVKPKKHVRWDSEVKEDHDGEVKQFIYLDVLCEYESGEPKVPDGHEKVQWLSRNEFPSYDIVPPARKLLEKIGYGTFVL